MLYTINYSTTVLGSYVTTKCKAYLIKEEGLFLIVIIMLFLYLLNKSNKCPFRLIKTGAR